MSLEHIFARPKFIEGVGKVHPIKLKDWDEFEKNANILLYSQNHFPEISEDDHPLLKIIMFGLQDQSMVDSVIAVLKMVFRTESIHLYGDEFDFFIEIDETNRITNENYDVVRKTIMQQNLLFEPKIYKDPLMAAWAKRVLDVRNKNGIDMELEDMISTVASLTGKHYWDLAEYSMYQLRYEFNRIVKLKEYETQTLAMTNPYADSSKMKMVHFAEKVDMFKSPYDDLFKSKDNLKNINKAIK